jgi:NAD kinase
MTALMDAVLNSIEATEGYAKQLVAMDYACNSIMFVITDGDENDSKVCSSTDVIKQAIKKIRVKETLESFTSVLIGVGDDPTIQDTLQRFKDDSGMDQFVAMGAATPGKLAKLADFVSKSISSTSQALKTGQASQPLSF